MKYNTWQSQSPALALLTQALLILWGQSGLSCGLLQPAMAVDSCAVSLAKPSTPRAVSGAGWEGISCHTMPIPTDARAAAVGTTAAGSWAPQGRAGGGSVEFLWQRPVPAHFPGDSQLLCHRERRKEEWMDARRLVPTRPKPTGSRQAPCPPDNPWPDVFLQLRHGCTSAGSNFYM